MYSTDVVIHYIKLYIYTIHTILYTIYSHILHVVYTSVEYRNFYIYIYLAHWSKIWFKSNVFVDFPVWIIYLLLKVGILSPLLLFCITDSFSLQICIFLIYLGAPWLGVCIFTVVLSSQQIDPELNVNGLTNAILLFFVYFVISLFLSSSFTDFLCEPMFSTMVCFDSFLLIFCEHSRFLLCCSHEDYTKYFIDITDNLTLIIYKLYPFAPLCLQCHNLHTLYFVSVKLCYSYSYF